MIFRHEGDIEQEVCEVMDFSLSPRQRQEMFEQLQRRIGTRRRSADRRGRQALFAGTAAAVLAGITVLTYAYGPWGPTTMPGAPTNPGPSNVTLVNDQQFHYPHAAEVMENQDQLSAEDQEKCRLIEKVAYAYRNFSTVKGSYVSKDSRTGGGTEINVEFVVREGQNPASYEKSTYADNQVMEHIVSGDYMIERRTGAEDHLAQLNPVGNRMYSPFYMIKKMESAPGQPNQDYSYFAPPDPAFTTWAKQVIAPLGDLPNYLLHLSEWSIAGEESLGHKMTTVIKGDWRGMTFKVWFDKDTGALLKEEYYDARGDVVMYLAVKTWEVNPQIDEKLFTIPQDQLDKLKKQREQRIAEQQKAPAITNDVAPIPKEIFAAWEIAAKHPEKTTVLKGPDGYWYIYPKQGYVVDHIETIGPVGMVIITKSAANKGTVPSKALNYGVTSMKVQEKE
jgi:hypothetical protein